MPTLERSFEGGGGGGHSPKVKLCLRLAHVPQIFAWVNNYEPCLNNKNNNNSSHTKTCRLSHRLKGLLFAKSKCVSNKKKSPLNLSQKNTNLDFLRDFFLFALSRHFWGLLGGGWIFFFFFSNRQPSLLTGKLRSLSPPPK